MVKVREDKDLEGLNKQKTDLKTKQEWESKQKMDKIDSEKYTEEMVQKIGEQLKGISPKDWVWNSGHLWKLRKKISPIPTEPPNAMENQDGVFMTNPLVIQKEVIHYLKKTV